MASAQMAKATTARNPNPGNSTTGRGAKPAPAKASSKAAAAKKQASKATTATPTKATKVAAGRPPQTKEQRAARGTMIQGAGEPTPEEAFRPVSLTLTPAGKLVSADAGGNDNRPDPRSLAAQLNRQLGDDGMRRVTTAIVVHSIVHEFYKRMAGLRAIKGQQAPSDAGVLRPYSVSALIREALIAHIPGYHQELLANGIDVAKEWQARYPDANLEEILGKL
jgi:hypothetical protein